MSGDKIELQVDGMKEFVSDLEGSLTEAETKLSTWLSSDAAADTVDSLFRIFHNIKGTSGMFGLTLVQEVFHNSESLLGVLREKRVKPTEDTVALLLQSLDEFKKLTAYAIENGVEMADKPYGFMHKLVEAKKAVLSAEAVGETNDGDDKKTGKKQGADDSIRISAQHGTELVEIVSDFIQLHNRLETALGSDGSSSAIRNDIRRFSSRLQGFVLSIRLAPIQPLLSGLQRTASAAAREVGKKFRMQITGGDTQLDRRVLEMLRDPLIHMIRNSIDHGIETPEQRAENTKPAEGLIVFEAAQQSGQVVLSMSDDGRGIDPTKVKAKALENGIITAADAEKMSDREAFKLIFLPGFSTAAKVTSLSGRGVGMDAVKTAVESIGGAVDVDSEMGRGTKVTLTLPLTLAIVKSLAFHVGAQSYAVPQTNVEEVITETMARSRGQLGTIALGAKVLHLRGAVVPVISLRTLFKTKAPPSDAIYVVIRQRSQRYALEVDRIVGPRDFVSQPLPEMHSQIDVINGVNQLNSGEYIALLDLGAMGRLLETTRASDLSSTTTQPATNEKGELVTTSDIFRSQQKLVFFKSGKLLALPVQAIRRVVPVERSAIDQVGDKAFLTHEGKTYPILRLCNHFNKTDLREQASYTALLVNRETHAAAIVCEEFRGIHRLPPEFGLLVKAPGIQGSVNHEGHTYLVINANSCFSLEFPEVFAVRQVSSKFHILIVEDDPFFSTSLSEYLRHQGFDVSAANDGQYAKDMLEASLAGGENTKPIDFVITDYEMPRMTGLELLDWMRHHASFSSMPVVMCTAVGDDSTKRAASKLGIDYYSGKMKYEDILPHLLRRQKGSEMGLSSEMTANQISQNAAVAVDTGEKRVLAFEVGDRTFGIDISELKEISTASVPTRIPGLNDAVSDIVGFRGHPIPVIDLRKLMGLEVHSGTHSEQIVAKFGNHLCALWVNRVHNVRRAKKMDKATALVKRSESNSIASLVGDVLWDDQAAISLLDGPKVAKFIDFIREKSGKLELVPNGETSENNKNGSSEAA